MKPLHLAFIFLIDCLWAANIVAVNGATQAVMENGVPFGWRRRVRGCG